MIKTFLFSLILQLIRLTLFIIACKGLLINVGKALYKFVNYICLIIINAPLAQSVDRVANNAKDVFSRLIRSRFHYLFDLLSRFK